MNNTPSPTKTAAAKAADAVETTKTAAGKSARSSAAAGKSAKTAAAAKTAATTASKAGTGKTAAAAKTAATTASKAGTGKTAAATKTAATTASNAGTGKTAAAAKTAANAATPAPAFSKTTIKSPSDGLEISVLCCTPSGKPKAIVQLVHGMCEHKERYMPLMEMLAGNGYVCYIHDHRGHGESIESIEDLGYFYDGGFLGMVEDIKAVGEIAKAAYPGLRHVLLGHSMGSMAVRSFVRRYDDLIDCLIVCGSPSYNAGSVVGKLIAKLDKAINGAKHRPKLIQKLSFGSFSSKSRKMAAANASGTTHAAPSASPNSWVCSDADVVSKYDRDPLCNFQFTADGFINLFSLMSDAYDYRRFGVRKPDMPILFISGADDPCLISHKDFRKAVDAMKKAGYTNVRSILYPGMRHEILNESDKHQVWNDLMDFIE